MNTLFHIINILFIYSRCETNSHVSGTKLSHKEDLLEFKCKSAQFHPTMHNLFIERNSCMLSS